MRWSQGHLLGSVEPLPCASGPTATIWLSLAVAATEFHERQGLDLSAVPRMSADDEVTASLRGLELGEVVCALSVEQTDLLDAVFRANTVAFAGQSPVLAERYRDS